MVAEVISDVEFDWVVVDAEHTPLNPETLLHMLMPFRHSSTVPIIRVPWNDHVVIKQMLDMGWEGILVPQVNSVEDARRAAAACRYPPVGNRGFGPMRASNYYADMDEYIELANDLVLCVVQIEDVKAADHAEEIVRVPGVDWVFVGAFDMSGTTDRFGDPNSAEVWGAIHRIFAAANAASVPCGNAMGGIKGFEELGAQICNLGGPVGWVRSTATQALAAFNEGYEALKTR
jgi:2-keto-3-deoxy-L-rhamnonate aldolase RhmA